MIGDHVYFFNHQAYDLINETVGNAWRLENTILIDRRGRTDLFLGHGSGRKTAAQLRAKLAEEYNDVADIALRLAGRADRGDATASRRHGHPVPEGQEGRRASGACRGRRTTGSRSTSSCAGSTAARWSARTTRPTPSRMYPVRRPIESA